MILDTHNAKARSASFPRDHVNAMRGTPDEWAELGQVNLDVPPDPGEYFMRLNAKCWGNREMPSDVKRTLKEHGLRDAAEFVWHGPGKMWLVCEIVRKGATPITDLLCVLWSRPGQPTIHDIDRLRRHAA